MIDLSLTNTVFLERKKKFKHSKHVKVFSITRGSIIRSDHYISAGNIFTAPTWKLFWKITFNWGTCKVNLLLRKVGYNNNSTQNWNIFQPAARDLQGISSVNNKFSNESIPYAYERKTWALKFKVFVIFYN